MNLTVDHYTGGKWLTHSTTHHEKSNAWSKKTSVDRYFLRLRINTGMIFHLWFISYKITTANIFTAYTRRGQGRPPQAMTDTLPLTPTWWWFKLRYVFLCVHALFYISETQVFCRSILLLNRLPILSTLCCHITCTFLFNTIHHLKWIYHVWDPIHIPKKLRYFCARHAKSHARVNPSHNVTDVSTRPNIPKLHTTDDPNNR